VIPSDTEFASLTDLFKTLFGLALGPEKRYLISLRLEEVLRKHQMKSYHELVQRCGRPESSELRVDVIDAMTTRETSFFRDGHPFQAFESKILPDLVRRFIESKKQERNKIRIWSAACSTGQEAYSLAMMIDENCRRSKSLGMPQYGFEDFSIVGTDISPQAISDAKTGQYTPWELSRGIDEKRKQQYFIAHDQGFRIREELKRILDFRLGNILQRNTMPSNMDFILCRNLLIYFDDEHRAELLEHMSQCLSVGGYLMLGAAEITSRYPKCLEKLSIGSTVVYRKQET
jgi:chemotaxis protein methyltransferase CheR